ncbi:uncharacterized protein PRCAT00003154001 [Priceomyces carsonii]|uniref:uncharacterized protein n=1 Tax=Priceomyces carsonii TaxID=28549 RepID=UPI002EDBA4DD|nr:unnamed protein product [Priceomyces carsonii]
MSALTSLKSLLDFDTPVTAEDEIKGSESLENLVSYIESQRSKSNRIPQLLELIRLEVIHGIDSERSQMWELDGETLSKLTDQFQSFHNEIDGQRNKMKIVGGILTDFNELLNDLSSNLTNLHDRSTKITSNVELQRATIEKLNPVILDLMIPPEVVRSIIHDQIEPAWLENIRFINEKLQLISNVKSKKLDKNLASLYEESKTFHQLEEGIGQLIAKAVERIRDFLISQIKRLRSSTSASSQTIQKGLLEVKEVFVFLEDHHKELAGQLRLAYIYTMKWYYQTKFAKYLYAIQKLNIKNVDLSLVLGASLVDDRASLFGLKSWMYNSNSSLHPPSQNRVSQLSITEYLMSLDKRMQILEDKATSEPRIAIPSQIAETTPFSYWLEFIFNQWLLASTDNVVVEYLFVVDFFYRGDEKFEDVPDDGPQNHLSPNLPWPHVMFENVYKMGNDFVTWLLSQTPSQYGRGTITANRNNASFISQGTCDAYAILLMIRLIQNSQSLLHNEFHVPILDDYLNSILLKLWPHFTKVIDLNCESMKKVTVIASNEAKLAPSAITQQFGQFLLGLLKLSFINSKEKSKDYRGEPLFTSITRLRNDFESVLTKLSTHIFGNGKKKLTEREIFLYNNYFLVTSILKNENDGSNEIVDEQVKHFETLCDAYRKN